MLGSLSIFCFSVSFLLLRVQGERAERENTLLSLLPAVPCFARVEFRSRSACLAAARGSFVEDIFESRGCIRSFDELNVCKYALEGRFECI